MINLDEAKKQLENEKRLRLLFERQVEELKLDIGMKESENIQLKREMAQLDEIVKKIKSNNQIATNLNQIKLNSLRKNAFTLLRKIDLKVEGCRSILGSFH